MSHNPDTHIICPNCGYDAKYNYCARCGQENHLHKDTFWGLIIHFVGHYFHYDSKAWKTMKTLWFKPGALTIAYREKQRMRYIPPISLYIFISAVFFLVVFFKAPSKEQYKRDFVLNKADSIKAAQKREAAEKKIYSYFGVKKQDSLSTHKSKFSLLPEDQKEEFYADAFEGMTHSIPKWFFFMIPLMGFVLLLLFARRKQLYFVDHAIFSLHFHAFVFSASLPAVLNPFDVLDDWLFPIMIIVGSVYFVIALRKVYSISWGKAIGFSLIVAFTYFIFLFFVFLASFMVPLYQHGMFKAA